MHSNTLYFNTFHKRMYKSPPVLCLNQNCSAIFRDIDITELLALVEYRIKIDPESSVKIECNRCKKTSLYDKQTLQALLPDELKPCPLPQGCAWAIFLIEIPTVNEMPQRAFFGERVLVTDLDEDTDDWGGTLVSESQFAPDLACGTALEGPKLNGHLLALLCNIDGDWKPIPLKDLPPKNSDIGMFFLTQNGDENLLECANPFCTNPSCGHIFGMTYSQFEVKRFHTLKKERSIGLGTFGYQALKCEICQMTSIVDTETFNKLFRI